MKVLFFVTNSYPFGKGEPLVAKQIDLFANDFDRVILLCSDLDHELSYSLPGNVEVYRISVKLKIRHKIWGLFRIFHKEYRDEYQHIRIKKNGFDYPRTKVALNYLAIALRYKRKFQQLIKKLHLENETLFFHSYWCTEGTLGFALLKKKQQHARMHTRLHAYDLYEERHTPPYLPFRKKIIEELDKLFFISEQGLDYFQVRYKEFIKPKQLVLNRLGVGFEQHKSTEFHEKHSRLRLVSCSSLIPLKRVHLIIETLTKIKDYPVSWTHFGEGPLLDELQTLAHNLLNSKPNIEVVFYGFIENDDLNALYRLSPFDLFINTSQYEGIPISMMEAMAAGIPCVGTDVGGVSELINSSNGYLLPVDFSTHELKSVFDSFYYLNKDQRNKLITNSFIHWKTLFDGLQNYLALKKEILPEPRVCSRCLYDTQDYPELTFDSEGVCSICSIYDDLQKRTVFKDDTGIQKLNTLLHGIKDSGNNKPYNCIIGVSGGVDSSYVAYLSKQWELRPLIVHVDNGWNSELATKNIENILTVLGYDLYTHVIDWQEMRSSQLAFIKASVLDIDLPFDNAFMAILYSIARKHKIRYILSGHNTVTEGWMPPTFTHYKLDSVNIHAIQRKFGDIKRSKLPTIGPIKKWASEKVYGIQMVNPLDLIPYDKNAVKKLLIAKLGWRDYGGKHYENTFTKFYQGYILPTKYRVDKRKAHLSTLICSGQLQRTEALEFLQSPAYAPDEVESDMYFFCKKLGISVDDFKRYMEQAPVPHTAFASYLRLFDLLRRIKHLFSN
jgi:N-acetyl sugar amidotransferase